jgi:hypothetical protein
MVKRLMLCTVSLLFVAGLTLGGQTATPKPGTWTGWVTDDMCGAKGASADHADCTKKCVKEHGAKYALYNPTDKKVYILDPQSKAEGHEGHEVTVKGSLDGDTIHVTSLKMVNPKPM